MSTTLTWGRTGMQTALALCAWSALAGETHQDFDNPGAPFVSCQYFSPPTASVEGDTNKPSRGAILRLATSPAVNHNGVVFGAWQPDACQTEAHVDFDFRITPVTGRADGLGLALLNTANWPASGCVAPQAPLFVAEEPSFAGSLGVGFDVYQNSGDIDNNHVSLHWNGALVGAGQFHAVTNLASGGFIHVHVRVRLVAGGGAVRVTLKPFGGAEEVVVNDVFVAGFAFSNWRVMLAGRSGGLSAQHDVDNLHVVSSGCPALDGQWEPNVLNFGRVAIHTHLLPTGKVLFWDRHDGPPGGHTETRLWDPANPGTPTAAALSGHDIFCAGHALDANGRLFTAGGHVVDNEGLPDAASYDAAGDTWITHPNMTNGRWYPTVTTLSNGELLTVAGSFRAGATVVQNDLPEVFNPAPGVNPGAALKRGALAPRPPRHNPTTATAGAWRALSTARQVQPLYPWMFQAPNGRVFDAGPQRQSRYLDTSGTGAWSNVAVSNYGHRDYGSAVMDLPGRALILGGTYDSNATTPTNSVERIDLGAATPSWTNVAPMGWARRQHTATLLPDGSTLVTGGTAARFFNESIGAVLHAEGFTPVTQSWRALGRGQEARLYHSVALLLPDARVLVAGGGHPNGGWGDPDHFTAELFHPPYLFQGARPVISALSALDLTYGQTLTVTTPDAATITDVTLLRLGSVTHAFNMNQRFNRLTFTIGAGALNANVPADARLCPPGHYLLFILRNGVPSVARIVRIA